MAINQLKIGAFLSYIILGLTNIVGLVYTPYMLRMMGQSEYGLYSLVASVIAYLTVLDLGFGNAIIRYTAKFRAENKHSEQYSMFGMFLILYTLIGIITFLIGLILYFNVDFIFSGSMTNVELGKARIMIMIMVFNLAFTFPLSIFGSIVSAYENFVFQKVVQIARILLNTIVMIGVLSLGYKAIAIIIVTSIFNLLSLVLNYCYCVYKIKIKIQFAKFDWSFLKEIFIYSFYIFLGIIIDRIYWSTGQFVLGAYVGTAAIAVFAIAIQLQQMYMSFSSAISGVFLPKVTGMITKEDSDKTISDLFIKTGRIQYIILAFILSGFIIFGKYFVIYWAGQNYIESYIIAIIFFIPLTIPLIQNLGIIILQARNQMRFRSLLYIIIALGSLALQIPLAKRFGGIGCAIGIATALFLGQVIAMNIYYYKKQRIDIFQFWKEIGKMSFVPTIMVIIFYFILTVFRIETIIGLIIAISAFILLYLPASWIFSMNNYEKQLISSPIVKILKKVKA